jgi:hypothetical protein
VADSDESIMTAKGFIVQALEVDRQRKLESLQSDKNALAYLSVASVTKKKIFLKH